MINTLIKLIKILAKNAVQKLDTVNPSTREETSISTKALMTRRNKPKVTIVKGSVKRINIGLTTALAKPNRSAAIANAPAVSNLMPLKM